ncbi:Prostaglandin E2 receptor EP3 subtype [Lonchura striata]|uniref:Prostaglandin E2 receptor EP3 subtype n=1 Tax=Lonchura striata TaxID=40157 RepID=A0A218UXX1_9PASE|nr:Prostaglandin E2 receptor EP3 subtype [Lonchura striata domestica]
MSPWQQRPPNGSAAGPGPRGNGTGRAAERGGAVYRAKGSRRKRSFLLPVVISVYLMTLFGLCPLLIASAMAVERALAIRAPHCAAGGSAFAAAFAALGLLSLAVTAAGNLATIGALLSRCRARPGAPRPGSRWGRIATETLLQLLGIMCVLAACWAPLLVEFQ